MKLLPYFFNAGSNTGNSPALNNHFTGFSNDGILLMVGNLQPDKGGAMLVHNISLPDIQNRVNSNPFVVENVVRAEILQITPGKTDDRFKFLLD